MNELCRERNVAVFESPQNFAGSESFDPYKVSVLPYMGKMTRRVVKNTDGENSIAAIFFERTPTKSIYRI